MARIVPHRFWRASVSRLSAAFPNFLDRSIRFTRSDESGHWISDRLPHLEEHLDDFCFIKSMHTDQFNHAPAQLLVHTGNARLGYASIGSWVLYGLGTENQNLPGFIVLLSGGKSPTAASNCGVPAFCPVFIRACNAVRMANRYCIWTTRRESAARCAAACWTRSMKSISRPMPRSGIPKRSRASPNTKWRFACKWMLPTPWTFAKSQLRYSRKYGSKPGEASFANNCLVARRLAERGVRFIQLYHWGWDSHGADAKEALNLGFMDRCREVDQPTAALLADLKERGMLEDTLVVWGENSVGRPCAKIAMVRK